MTHEELLGRLQDPIAWMQSESESDRRYSEETYSELKRHLDVYLALRTVVELHKPHGIALPTCACCTYCVSCDDFYPCPTIQTIMEEVK